MPTSASISLTTTTSGRDDNDIQDLLSLAVGDNETSTFMVTNTGEAELIDVDVTDTVLGAICSIASLPIGASAECPPLSFEVTTGTYRSVGTVFATPVDADGESIDTRVSSSDTSTYVGVPSSN